MASRYTGMSGTTASIIAAVGAPSGTASNSQPRPRRTLSADALSTIGIVLLQTVIVFARTDQYQLGANFERLGFERHRRQLARYGARFLDLQAAVTQVTLQLLPYRGVARHITQMQHQIPVMSTMEIAGANTREIRREYAAFGLEIDTAEQGAEYGIVIAQCWSACGDGIVHQYVDAISR